MAEVRQIPSAVGAFEAQVFDMSKTYRTIMAQNAAAQKRQAQAQKDIEKQMDIALADKRIIRPQDTDAIEEAKMEAYNYFYNNRDKVNSSSSAMNELKTKMGKFTALVSESNALKKQGDTMNPVLKQALDPKNEMDEGLVDALDMWNKPINDPTRQKATFSRNGVATNINEFNISDLTYFEKFDENKDLNAPITANVKPYTKTSMELSKNKKLGGMYVDNTTGVKVYDDNAIVNSVITAATSSKSRGFMSNFDQQLKLYNSFPKEDRDLEFKSVVDAYKDLTGSDITRHFRKEGGEGIDTPLEFAAFKKLQEKLPQVVKDTYDYRTQNALLNTWRYNLTQSKWNFQKEQTESLDVQLINDIKSGKFDPDKWNSIYKPLINVGHPSDGSVRSSDINWSKDARGNVIAKYNTQTIMTDENNAIMTNKDYNFEEAQAKLGKSGARAVVSEKGFWYASKDNTVIVGGAKDPAITTKITTLNDNIEESINIQAVKDTYQAYRKKKTQVQGELPGAGTKTTAKGSTSSTSVKKKKKG